MSAYAPCWNIFYERPYVKLFAVVWRYWSMISLCHLPTRQMVSGSTCAMRRAMALPVHRERALMLALVNPIAGSAARTTDPMAAVMLYPLIYCHLVAFLKLDRGVLLVAPWRQRYVTS